MADKRIKLTEQKIQAAERLYYYNISAKEASRHLGISYQYCLTLYRSFELAGKPIITAPMIIGDNV